jgi:hypothetical protein
MISNQIYKKIQQTKLFSDSQKVELLVKLVDATEADRTKLEAGIDAFDARYAQAVATGTQKVKSVLGHVLKDMNPEDKAENQDALDQLSLGLAFLN